MLIEQAIFTSAQTRRMGGYQLVSSSPGISREDARDLAHWGPAHDSLQIDSQHNAVSINFHPLASGALCISKTVSAGAEYSGRGAGRIYSQCLVVTADVLLRFANNPFRLLDAVVGGGHVGVRDEIPEQLEPISLLGKASIVDRIAIDRLLKAVGVEPLVALINALLSTESLAVKFGEPAKLIFAGLITVLPVECRPEVSFSTGLKHSSSRPFCLETLAADSNAPNRARRSAGPVPIDLAKETASPTFPTHPWAELIGRLLSDDNMPQLNELLESARPGLTLEQLDSLSAKVSL